MSEQTLEMKIIDLVLDNSVLVDTKSEKALLVIENYEELTAKIKKLMSGLLEEEADDDENESNGESMREAFEDTFCD